MKKTDIHKWFESCNGMKRDGITASVRAEYGKKAYVVEYRWGNDHGVNMRFDLELTEHCHHYCEFTSLDGVQNAINQGFAYALSVKSMVSKK